MNAKSTVMVKFPIFLTALIVSLSLCYGQTQETVEKFQYKPPGFLYEEKCSKCHTLERVFAELKTESEWQICVTRMMKKNKFWITEEEGAQIIDEIVGKRKDIIAAIPQKKKYADAQVLFIDRCTRCHKVSRILDKNKTRDEWVETIIRMRDNAPELFFDEDIPVIADFLTERGNIIRDDIAAQIMEEKCLVCHEAGRILLERKSRKDWEKCVADMRIQVRKDFKKDWFTKDEFNLIVDLLVKTQGIKGNEE
jgi:cytochrome c2